MAATILKQRPSIYSQQRPDAARLAFLHLMAETQDEAAERIEQYREFYGGEHPTLLTQRQAAYLNVSSDSVFSFNHCPIVVDSLVERLAVTGFATPADEQLAETLWQWWKANRMDGQQILAHTFAARDGAAYVVVDWNAAEDRPGFHVNEAWDGESGVKVHWAGPVYPGQQILFASKRWRVEFEGAGRVINTYRRLNIYYPDRIEKYRSGASSDESGWEPFWDEGDNPDVWPLPWVDEMGRPLGVPVVPFLNRQTGVSELRDVIPIQVAVNKLLVDLLAAADVEGFGIFTKTGGGIVTNPEVFPGAFWQDTDPSSAWGKLPGAELTGLLATLDRLTMAVAVVTRRPLSYFTAQATTSGEHLKQLEAGLVSTAKAAQVTFGNSWEDMMRLALRLGAAFGREMYDPDAQIDCQWADPESRNETEHTASVLLKMEKGAIDDFQALKELGYDADTIKAILVRKEIERLRTLQLQPATPVPPPEHVQPTEPDEEAPMPMPGRAPRRGMMTPTETEAMQAQMEGSEGTNG